jgi:hypothetical protein
MVQGFGFGQYLEALSTEDALQPLLTKAKANDMLGCVEIIKSLPLQVLNKPIEGCNSYSLLMMSW